MFTSGRACASMPLVSLDAGEAVGAVLNGQWRLIRLIGEGGLAAVYEAEGQQGQGRRAIKLLHPQFVGNRAVVERFYAEAQTCFSLRHPHIAVVEAYAYAEDGSPYLVMELLEGENLEEYLQKGYPLTEAAAAPILYGVLQALSCAHARGIVHRDLKPPNLFLVPAGNGQYTVKVLDFGIAKVMDIAGGMGSKTRTGAVLGTPGYMSPEQVKNAKAVDARTDIWSVGIVFYEMLTCIHPFGQADNLSRMVAVLRDPPKPITELNPALAKWSGFFDKSLARNPDERFQSAEEMAEALRSLAQGTPAQFVPDGLQTVAIRQMSDQRTPASAGQRSGGGTQASPAVGRGPQGTQQTPSVAMPPSGYAAAQSAQPASMGYPSSPPPASRHHKTENMMPAIESMVPSAPQPAQPAMQPAVTPGPIAGARPASATQVSRQRPDGTPTVQGDVPAINVYAAADPDPPSLVWWGVILVGVGCFALGLLLGYVLA